MEKITVYKALKHLSGIPSDVAKEKIAEILIMENVCLSIYVHSICKINARPKIVNLLITAYLSLKGSAKMALKIVKNYML